MGKYAVLVILAHLLILNILPFTTWPEMLLYPWLTAQGFIQYREIIHPYSIGLIATLMMFGKVVGFTAFMVKVATYTIVVLCDLLVYRLVLIFGTQRSAIVVLLLYMLWQISFEGNGLWFDLVLTPPALLAFFGLVQWLRNQQSKWLFLAGAALVMNMLIKQTGMWFVITAVGVLFFYKQYRASALLLVSVISALLLYTVFGYFTWGTEFLYWTIWFPLVDQKLTAGFVLLPTAREVALAGLLLVPAAIGFFAQEHSRRILFLLWVAAGSLSAFPRWGLFHLQPALPFLALFIGSGLSRSPKYVFLSLIIPALYVVFTVTRSASSGDRFVTAEVLATAQILKHEVGTADLFILGAPQLLYVLSGYIPPRPWADLFPWYYQVRGGELEVRMFKSLEASPPEFVLRAPVTGDHPEYRYRPQKIERWVDENYQQYETLPAGVLWNRRS